MKKNSAFKLKSGNKPSPAKLFGTKQRKARDIEAEQIARASGIPFDDDELEEEKKRIKKNMLKGKKYDV